MTKQLTKLMLVAILALSFAIPVDAAGSPSYRYRSTVTGTGVRNAGGFVNEIVGQKENFSQNESIYYLTRIFAITNIDSFQFRHEIYGNDGRLYRRKDSPLYTPHRGWWAETYYWNGLEPLPVGDYTMRVFIRTDGGGFRQVDTKRFTVGNQYGYRDGSYCYDCGGYDYNYDWDYNYDQNYYYDRNYDYGRYNDYCGGYNRTGSYSLGWTKLGTAVNYISGDEYSLSGERYTYNSNERVVALTRLNNLSNIDRYTVRFELFGSSNNYIKRIDASEKRLYCNSKSYNYAWGDFGQLSSGNYEIRASISVNGGAYTRIDTKSFNVQSYYYPQYNYGWTGADTWVRQTGNYSYEITNPKTTFNTNERVVVLTRLSNIRGIDHFTVRQAIYRRSGGEVKTMDAPTQYPRNNNWEYNYAWNDFGYLSSGDYELRVYISVNGGSYKQLDTKYISVTGYYYDQSSYNYNWTQTGTAVSYHW